MKKMTSNEIRNLWLNFFSSKGHKIEKGASLIPHNDPTLLWINSGVAALKKYFDGSEIPPSKRITNVQKSIRTNDIDNVGHTARHHTLFEMLGNFSIGDYFRNEVLPWAYELLFDEKWFGFPKDKLYITYFPTDLETYKLWVSLGIDPSHMVPCNHNFWEIGEGPCGPNTEMFFDRGEKYDPEHLGEKLIFEDLENDRYIEIWNIVFSQYNAVSGVDRKDYKELPSKNIDTGAGLERFCCILQETETNFETDLFYPIIEETEKIASKPYEGDYKSSYRVIADHIRACTFALSDGESFSNEGRGYVLRRLLRRAMRYAQKIGITKPFLSTLVPVVVDIMKGFYPDLINNVTRIQKTIDAEEKKFINTLENGELVLRKMIQSQNQITGSDAFKLYDTFGFPIELTMEILEENNISIDMEDFKQCMEKQKEIARKARGELQSMSKQSKDLMEFVTPSSFLYDSKPLKAKVIGLFKDGVKVDCLNGEGSVIFDKTNMYAEMGGQVSDSGTINNETCYGKVVSVSKAPNKQHLHDIEIDYGEIHIGDEFVLSIDMKKRLAIERNHSATHLLQAALNLILGDDIAQAGSSVSDENAHFDFNFTRKITEEELSNIEKQVNVWISDSILEETKVLPIEEAKKLGAKALFDEKYGNEVRVVCFGDVSKEFCGGTHVKNTSDIGLFVIEFEESVASGIRRIQFRTSLGAYSLIKQKDSLLSSTRKSLSISSNAELLSKLNALKVNKDDLAKQVDTLTKKIANMEAGNILNQFEDIKGYKVLIKYIPNADRTSLSTLVDNLKTKVENHIILVVGGSNSNLPIVCSVNGEALKQNKAGMLVSLVSKELLGSGGGRPDFAMGAGKDASKLENALNQCKEAIN